MENEHALDAETAENLASDDVTTDNARSFSDLETLTETVSPERLLKQARKHAESTSTDQSKTEARTTKNASEKQPQEAAEELSDNIESDMVEELKMLKAARGDNEYEIPEDAVITVKVDGEEVNVPIAELRNNYSGKTAWDKKFTELDKERKEYLEDRGLVERYVNEFRELAQSENKVAALEYLAQLSGQDPLAFRRELESQMFEKFQQMQGLSDPEIEALRLREENEFLLRQKESEAQRASQYQTQKEVEAKLDELQETHGLDRNDIVELHNQVITKYGNNLTDDQILAQMSSLALHNRAMQGAEYLLSKVNPDLINDQNVSVVTDFIKENPEFTEEDFVEMISDAYGAQTTKKVSKKAKEAAKPAEAKETKREIMPKLSAITFDDL